MRKNMRIGTKKEKKRYRSRRASWVHGMRVWFLASEVAPFAKTGGLADVAGTLPKALKELGVDVRVALPFYRVARKAGFAFRAVYEGLEVPVGSGSFRGDVFETITQDDVPVYLFDQKELFDRPFLYGTPEGDYPDNLERFTYFSRGALIFARQTDLRFDIVHCHDWQTGLVPAYLKTLYRDDPFFQKAASVFTIHNVGYQGLFPPEKLTVCGLPASEYNPERVEYWGKISLLKAGIVYADAITTVSPRYSLEIQTPEFGLGMDPVLRARSADLFGILNGADYTSWNPETDQYICARYGPNDLEGKTRCKADLVEKMGLDRAFLDRPIVGVISRLTEQKGYDLLIAIMEDMLNLDLALVVLGDGEHRYRDALREIGQRYRGKTAIRIGFDDALAHQIMAGTDMLLVPSRYEPCGLTQLYALRYGTVPIVRATGGLDDTVEPFDAASFKGTGFKFSSYRPESLLEQITRAVRIFEDGPVWRELVRNGMRACFSPEASARRHVALYEKLIRREPPR